MKKSEEKLEEEKQEREEQKETDRIMNDLIKRAREKGALIESENLTHGKGKI